MGFAELKESKWMPWALGAVCLLCVVWIGWFVVGLIEIRPPATPPDSPRDRTAHAITAELNQDARFPDISAFASPDEPNTLIVAGELGDMADLEDLKKMVAAMKGEYSVEYRVRDAYGGSGG